MRIVCPHCQSDYDVPERAVLPDGRDMQCAACGRGWYQLPPLTTGGVARAEPAESEPQVPDPTAMTTFSPRGDEPNGHRAAPTRRDSDEAGQLPRDGERAAWAWRMDTDESGTLAAEARPAGGTEAGSGEAAAVPAGELDADRPEASPQGSSATAGGAGMPHTDGGGAGPTAPKRRIDPAVLAVLQTEAAHEARLRQAEAAKRAPSRRRPEQADPQTGGSLSERLARLRQAERAASARPGNQDDKTAKPAGSTPGSGESAAEGTVARRAPGGASTGPPRSQDDAGAAKTVDQNAAENAPEGQSPAAYRAGTAPGEAARGRDEGRDEGRRDGSPLAAAMGASTTAARPKTPGRAGARVGDGATLSSAMLPARIEARPLALIAAERQRRGFRIGFWGPVAVAAAALALYLAAPLAATLPVAGPLFTAIAETGGEAHAALRARLHDWLSLAAARLQP